MSRGQSNAIPIYHGGTVSVRRHFSKGFTFAGSYTYGKVLTDSEVEQDVTNFLDVGNRAIDRSVASFDVPQRLSLNGVWDLPLLRGCNSMACKIAGGWQLSGSAVCAKGLPLTVFTSAAYPRGDFNADGNNNDRPNAPASSVQTSGFSRDQYLIGMFKIADFPAPALGRDGNLGRHTHRAPGVWPTSPSMATSCKMTQRLTCRPRVEPVNAFHR